MNDHAFETTKLVQSFSAGWYNKHAKNEMPSEKDIVSLIAKKCKFPDDLLLEYEDIAKTFEVLEKHKAELDEQKKPYSYIKKILFFKIKKTHAGKSKADIEDELSDISEDYQKLIESVFFLINEWE